MLEASQEWAISGMARAECLALYNGSGEEAKGEDAEEELAVGSLG